MRKIDIIYTRQAAERERLFGFDKRKHVQIVTDAVRELLSEFKHLSYPLQLSQLTDLGLNAKELERGIILIAAAMYRQER